MKIWARLRTAESLSCWGSSSVWLTAKLHYLAIRRSKPRAQAQFIRQSFTRKIYNRQRVNPRLGRLWWKNWRLIGENESRVWTNFDCGSRSADLSEKRKWVKRWGSSWRRSDKKSNLSSSSRSRASRPAKCSPTIAPLPTRETTLCSPPTIMEASAFRFQAAKTFHEFLYSRIKWLSRWLTYRHE